MIVIETSALIAILNHEPEREAFYETIAAADRRLVSAVSYQEAGHVFSPAAASTGFTTLKIFLLSSKPKSFRMMCISPPFGLLAFQRYGKGIDPNARLNFCDCAAYALAKAMHAPLLFKGNDFTHTDIARA